VAVEEDRQDLRRARPELDRLARGGAGLGDPPELGVLERVLRIVLDLADDARPAPRRLDLVHQRAGRELEQSIA
jgi:AcrR family transcriptional regulator